ncbi:MAG TPA: tetratricopeptide repeat protein [Alphaproteobacteria bacterium]|nr:tetratricopeptide repeat protein [Alphaproteobacteria bacterium]
MALGFGFNKAKVLSSAEKFVQQGKLPNAIAEYEKIIKEDPKDLTVLNTIGDLYARLGQNDQACEYFKRVGDQYAQNGFAVKAIAIYKKLTKLNPGSVDSIVRLAEFYAQQGLFNDARQQYMTVADQLLKAGDHTQGAKVLQKILELDPENAATQSKLADLYIKLGKKQDALSIFYNSAETLFARTSYVAADEALERVLALEPNNPPALQLRGKIALASGDYASAVQHLERIPDLDSHADLLQALLKAKLQIGDLKGVDALGEKLLTLHNDLSGIHALAQYQVANNHFERALDLYDRYSERFLAAGQQGFTEVLVPMISRIRENTAALQTMGRLLEQAGDTSHANEITEMLAHAFAQKGDYVNARDLYKKLSELEPENALHLQNYKQMLTKLGADSATRTLSAEEGAQAFMVEELEHVAPAVNQTYDTAVERQIEAALTDAELFVSYNVPSKAVAPLEAVLPLAPRDVHLNQRLAILYAKAERWADASRACSVLSQVFGEFGHAEEAEKYGEAASKYARYAGTSLPASTPAAVAPQPALATPNVAVEPAHLAPAAEPEFSFEVPDHISAESEHSAVSIIDSSPQPPVNVAPAEVHQETQPLAREIDLSGEWEDMVEVEPVETHPPMEEVLPAEHPEPVVHEFQTFEPVAESLPEVVVEPPAPAPEFPEIEVKAPDVSTALAEKVEEIRFYIAQGMWEPAKAGVLDLTEIAPDAPEIDQLMAEVVAGQTKAAASKDMTAAAPATVEEHIPTPALEATPAHLPGPIEVPADEFVLEVEEEPLVAEPPAEHRVEPVMPQAAKAPPVPLPPAVRPDLQEKSTEDILSDFVSDMEESLGDFIPNNQPHAPVPSPIAVEPAHQAPAAVADAAPTPAPVAAAQTSTAEETDSGSILNDILADLQREVAEPEEEAEDDPETRYNLGVAFKEMGLLDEAIGELQKVCHAVERGVSFSQPIQAYTWLAQCLVDKGVPEASVRWYERALQLPGLDSGSRCAIYYDLASAYEAFGDRKAALNNFMEVYSSNIDYRDVASRIKTLKS